jgi:uncharacterized protein YqhQ
MADAPIGGQAVLEGVMMRGVGHWAVAVRLPVPDLDGADKVPDHAPATVNGEAGPAEVAGAIAANVAASTPEAAASAGAGELGEIAIHEFEIPRKERRRRLVRLPLVRGVVALVESLRIGMRALSIAANAQMPEEAQEMSGGIWAGTIVISVVFAVGLFFVVPVSLTNLIKGQLGSSFLFWLVEGLVRTAIFLGYLWLLSRMRDLRRVFEYHGAEHKVIACHEAGDELVAERAALYPRLHPRCGTSFLLVVMIVAIFVFAPIGLPAWWLLVLTRILGIPVIAGISFEIIRFAGRNREKRWVQFIMYPGLQLQRLTTREPDKSELEVAIAALRAVLNREVPGQLTADDMLGLEVVA